MRARVIGAVLVVIFGVSVTLTACLYATGALPAKTSAADTTSIHLIAAQVDSRKDAKSGDACSIVKRGEVPGFGRQIIVKNEAGVIIGKQTLIGTTYQSFDGSPLYCALTFSIDVPDARFYTVFVDDERVTTWAKSDIRSADNPVFLTLPED